MLVWLQLAVATREESDPSRSRSNLSSSVLPRWWRADSDSDSQSAVQSSLRHYQWQIHQRRRQHGANVKNDAENRKFWMTKNGSDQEEAEEPVDAKRETQEGLNLLENLVHPEEELLDEINDRQIIQAVISSMAQWNLRKLQKMQRKSDHSR